MFSEHNTDTKEDDELDHDESKDNNNSNDFVAKRLEKRCRKERNLDKMQEFFLIILELSFKGLTSATVQTERENPDRCLSPLMFLRIFAILTAMRQCSLVPTLLVQHEHPDISITLDIRGGVQKLQKWDKNEKKIAMDIFSYIGGLMGCWLGISVWACTGIVETTFWTFLRFMKQYVKRFRHSPPTRNQLLFRRNHRSTLVI
ncbi:hypothetical protein NPIL_508041 [Nephila pilipes]|uniref:Uncharacterized protein n=1 Tax=Nephila pilipes TaxID=299642 RepID=A0A8X6IEX5_NEPPI|nr:hypothetical protein NPIL_508041 [Nephila pilipes]